MKVALKLEEATEGGTRSEPMERNDQKAALAFLQRMGKKSVRRGDLYNDPLLFSEIKRN
jgi:hypothetical protein